MSPPPLPHPPTNKKRWRLNMKLGWGERYSGGNKFNFLMFKLDFCVLILFPHVTGNGRSECTLYNVHIKFRIFRPPSPPSVPIHAASNFPSYSHSFFPFSVFPFFSFPVPSYPLPVSSPLLQLISSQPFFSLIPFYP